MEAEEVAYYDQQPKPEDVPQTKATIMLQYGGPGPRVNAGILAYEAALKAAGTKYECYTYDGINHAFNNNTLPARYNAKAAKLTGDRTLRLFGEKVG